MLNSRGQPFCDIGLLLLFSIATCAVFISHTTNASYAHIPYDANATALCELLNGTCVEPSNCAVFGYGPYDSHHGHQQKFACNLTTVCCYRPHHHLHVPHGYGKPSILKTLIFKSNRSVLCESLGGVCTNVHSCAVFQHYGGQGHRFDCNLTSLCCYRSSYGHGIGGHGHGHHGYGSNHYGHGHGNYHSDYRHDYPEQYDVHVHDAEHADYVDYGYFNDYHHGFGRKRRSIRLKRPGTKGYSRWKSFRKLQRKITRKKLNVVNDKSSSKSLKL